MGKTAFARLLAARLGARLVLESTNNPFLGEFYDDPASARLPGAALLPAVALPAEGRRSPAGPVRPRRRRQRPPVRPRSHLRAAQPQPRRAGRSTTRSTACSAPRCRAPTSSYTYRRGPRCSSRVSGGGQRMHALPPRDYIEKVAEAYAEFFFHYGDSPLLVVNTSEIDFVESRAESRRSRSGHPTHQGRRLPLQPARNPLRERDGGGT